MLLEVGGEDLAAVPEVVTLDGRSVSLAVEESKGRSCVGTHKGLCPTRRRRSFCPESSV